MESSKKPKTSTKEATAAVAAAQDAKRPRKTLRIEDCSASIWAREYAVQGKPRTFFTVTLERSYRGDGATKWTKSFDPDSLGKVIALCQQADEVIREMEQAAEKSHEDAQQEVA